MSKLYYQEEGIRIYCGDSRELIKRLPDKSIPLTFADPPYGIGLDYNSPFEDTQEYYQQMMDFLLTDVLRVSKVLVVTPGGYTNTLQWFDKRKPNWDICWYKGAVATRSMVGFSHWEHVLIYGDGSVYGEIPDFIHAQPEMVKEGHPCPKPEKLLMFFINAFTKERELVFDPFLGGGTTLVAAKMLNRKGLGCDLSETYCSIAANRVSREMVMEGVVVKNLHQEELFEDGNNQDNN